MTVHRAANPRHVRQFDTDTFWWLEDAWNEKSTDWWASLDDAEGSRIRSLLQFASRMRQSGIPELSPSAEWLAEVIQRHPATRVELDSSLSHLPLAYQVAVAYEKVEERRVGYGSSAQEEFLAIADPGVALAASMDLTEEMFQGGNLFRTPKGKRGLPRRLGNRNRFRSAVPAIARGMLSNPQLPDFDRPEPGSEELSTWQAVLLHTHEGGGEEDVGILTPARDLLLRNLGASEEDLLFAAELVLPARRYKKELGLEVVSRLTLSSHKGVYSQNGVVLELVASHPNFISHPEVDDLYPVDEPVVVDEDSPALPATAKPLLSSEPQERRPVLAQCAAGGYVSRRLAQEAIYETILNTPEEEVRAWHANLLKEYLNEVTEGTKPSLHKLTVLSETACLLGATFAGVEETAGELSDQVPLEWILELMGS